MHVPKDLHLIKNILTKVYSRSVAVNEIVPIGGGSISSTFKVYSSAGLFFLKQYMNKNASSMYKMEADGLAYLRARSSFTFPEVIARHDEESVSYLILNYIDSSSPSKWYWDNLGMKLAELHKISAPQFGFRENNFIGSLPQMNKFESDWSKFFVEQRITPMLEQAQSKKLVDRDFINNVYQALPKITLLMPEDSPALLHGDLWSGNLMPDASGNPTLIDPAIYYGHREMELAFTHLFGGFSQEFYERYNEVYPLEPGFEDRIDLYNIYPLLVHLNLFGVSYLPHIKRIIHRFI